MRKGMFALAAAGLLATGTMAACGTESGSGDTGSGKSSVGKVGVILPDTKSSARWETADLKYLTEAFKAAGVEAEIKNAQGDKASFQTIADGMITYPPLARFPEIEDAGWEALHRALLGEIDADAALRATQAAAEAVLARPASQQR